MIKLYLPVYNGASFLESAEVPLEFDVTVVDAGSTDRSAEAAEARGWNVIKRATHTDRIDNWDYAVRHFVQSQEAWCKWLFTGDRLYGNAHELLMKAILNAPQAKLVICEYDVIIDGERKRWKMFPDTQLLAPPQTMWLTAKLGNWFGSPVGQCFSREVVAEGFSFGPWTWAADMQFCYNIAKQWPVLYVAESIGEFHADARKTFSSQCNALGSSVEEFLIRMQAARDYHRATEDKTGYEELCQWVARDTEALIISRAVARAESSGDIEHLFKAIPMKDLVGGVFNRFWSKVQR